MQIRTCVNRHTDSTPTHGKPNKPIRRTNPVSDPDEPIRRNTPTNQTEKTNRYPEHPPETPALGASFRPLDAFPRGERTKTEISVNIPKMMETSVPHGKQRLKQNVALAYETRNRKGATEKAQPKTENKRQTSLKPDAELVQLGPKSTSQRQYKFLAKKRPHDQGP